MSHSVPPTVGPCLVILLKCDRKPLLHAFSLSQNLQAYSMSEVKQDINLLPCSLAIVNAIQLTFASLPFGALLKSGLDNTFILEQSLPPGAMPRVSRKCSGQILARLLQTSR